MGAPSFAGLAFAPEGASEEREFRRYLRVARRDLTSTGYTVELKVNDAKVVHSAFARFVGFLYEMGLSPQHGVLSVKSGFGAWPFAGGVFPTSLIRRSALLQSQHHGRASLLARVRPFLEPGPPRTFSHRRACCACQGEERALRRCFAEAVAASFAQGLHGIASWAVCIATHVNLLWVYSRSMTYAS